MMNSDENTSKRAAGNTQSGVTPGMPAQVSTSRQLVGGVIDALVGDFNTRYFLEILFRRKYYILIPLLLTPAICLGLTSLMRPSYLSTTTILLGKQDILNPLLRRETAATMGDMNRLSSFRKIILSRPLIEDAIESVGLSRGIKTPHEMEKVVKRVRKNIEIMGLQADSFQIGYTAPTPNLAKDMVETISRLFIDKSLQGSRREAEAAVTFIKKAVVHYHEELDRTESELENFRHDNAETLQQNRSLGTQLDSHETRLLDAELELQAEELREKLLSTQLAGESKMVIQKAVYMTNTRYQAKFQELALKKVSLLTTRTESHHEVQKIQMEMDNIRQLVKAETKMNAASETQEIRSPTYIAINSQLEQTRVRIQVLQQKVKDFKRLRDSAQKKVRDIPKLERAQNRMEGEVKLTREIYDNLRMKLEQAQVSRDIEIEQQASRYTIIDPPLAPLSHHRPIKVVYAGVGIIAGLFIGTVFAFMMELTAPQLIRSSELTSNLNVPVLGIIPRLYSRQSWLGRLLFGAFSAPRCGLPKSLAPDFMLDSEKVQLVAFSDDKKNRGLEELIERVRFIGLGMAPETNASPAKICMITSAAKQDGKSLLATNLAVIQACDLWGPVLLIDMNSKHPTISQRLGNTPVCGLGEIIEGTAVLDKALQETSVPNLMLLSPGDMPNHPAALLNAEEFSNLLRELRKRFALIIIDAPNLLDHAESCQLLSHVDCVVLVCRLFHTRKSAIQESLQRVSREKLLGMVVNCDEQWLPSWLNRRV